MRPRSQKLAAIAALLALVQPSNSGATRIACTGSDGERALTSAHFVRPESDKMDLDRSLQDFADKTGSTIYRYQVLGPGQTKSKNEYQLLRFDQAVEIEINAEFGERGISVEVSRACSSHTSRGWKQYWQKLTDHLRQQGFQQTAR